METIAELFDAMGGPSAVARVLDVRPSTASEMKRRRSIPPEYWLALVAEAARNGVKGVTTDALARIHARERGRLPAETVAAEA
jgi:hypothetical protein